MQKQKPVNNTFYDELHEGWVEGQNHPIALLRAENRLRNPWILNSLKSHGVHQGKILDIGCGGGLLTTCLADVGYQVTGIDLSKGSLDFARSLDLDHKIDYLEADALNLPFEDKSFDAICMMDLLEHVPCYKKALDEACRVLKDEGLLFFHTFNRNILSYLVIIKGVEWFVKNTPEDMHRYSFFIKPQELKNHLASHNMRVVEIKGLIPDFLSRGFLKMLRAKTVSDQFKFRFSKSLLTGYVGFAKKEKNVLKA